MKWRTNSRKRGKLKKDIVLISNQLKIGLDVLLYNTLLHQVNIAVRSRYKVISIRHQKKIINIIKNQKKNYENNKPSLMKRMVHNFSSYTLTEEQMTALASGLDHHIPTNINKNAIFTEFEQFFQNLFRDISHIPEDEHETYQTYLRMKTKLSNTCEKFCNAKGSYKYRDIVSKLSKRQDISKEKAAEYYLQNKETIKEKSKNRYKNMSKEEKDTIKEYQRKIHQQLIQYKKEALQNKLVLFLLSIRMR